jgi:hypothetical protein
LVCANDPAGAAHTIATTSSAANNDRRRVFCSLKKSLDVCTDFTRASTCCVANFPRAIGQRSCVRQPYIFLTTISGLPNHARPTIHQVGTRPPTDPPSTPRDATTHRVPILICRRLFYRRLLCWAVLSWSTRGFNGCAKNWT